jgi:hypothetical protein
MNCAICDRPMLRPGLQIGKMVVGPKCALKAGLVQPKRRYLRLLDGGRRQVVDPRQPDLFGVAA